MARKCNGGHEGLHWHSSLSAVTWERINTAGNETTVHCSELGCHNAHPMKPQVHCSELGCHNAHPMKPQVHCSELGCHNAHPMKPQVHCSELGCHNAHLCPVHPGQHCTAVMLHELHPKAAKLHNPDIFTCLLISLKCSRSPNSAPDKIINSNSFPLAASPPVIAGGNTIH